jgi:hypothetical protein
LSVAFEDWAFQAEGLRGDALGTALAFFDLSEGEMRRIIGCSDYRGRTIPVAAAERIRALAQQAEARTVARVGVVVVVSSFIATVLGLALVTS